jgi:hypothetical protein
MIEKYWISSTGSVFDSTENWSLSSGGFPGASIPGPSDMAIFDASGQGACLFNIPVSLEGLRVTADYSGVLLQQQYPITIGTSDASFDGGIFSGSFAPITIYSALYIGSTNFINTSGLMTLYGPFQFSPSLIPIPVDDFLTEEYALRDFDATARYLVVKKFPRSPEEVAMSIVEGVAQDYGSDYYVYGMSVKWDGRELEDYLATGDVVRISYPPDPVPGKFFHNFGTFKAMTTSTSSTFRPNGARFYNLQIDNDMTPAGYRLIDSTSFVENQLLLTGGYLRCGTDGTFNALGDIYCNQHFGKWSNDHNALINIVSGGVQNIFTTGGILPHVLVDKTTEDQVKFFGDAPMYINGDLLINDGTVNTNGVFLQVGIQ